MMYSVRILCDGDNSSFVLCFVDFLTRSSFKMILKKTTKKNMLQSLPKKYDAKPTKKNMMQRLPKRI